MKCFLFLVAAALFLFVEQTAAQNEGLQVGSSNLIRQSQGGLYDYSDPETINMRVAVWGFVKYPGRYIIPSYSTFNDLISYAGGPTIDAKMDVIKIYRTDEDSVQSAYTVNYSDCLWDIENSERTLLPDLMPGDIVLVPGAPRLYFKDWFQITLSVVSTLISLSILLINIAE